MTLHGRDVARGYGGLGFDEQILYDMDGSTQVSAVAARGSTVEALACS